MNGSFNRSSLWPNLMMIAGYYVQWFRGQVCCHSFVHQDKSIPRVAYAREVRLREDDIILANNGKIFTQDIDEFREVCDQACSNEKKLLLTICRGEVIFDLLITERLGVEFDYCDADASAAAAALFAKHHVGPKDDYRNYEALRDIHRHVVLYDTEYSSVATIAPIIWLLQHRAWEPLVAVIAAYSVSFAVHWAVFIVVIFLIAVYFHRIQFRLIRNYSLFTEHYFLACLRCTKHR